MVKDNKRAWKSFNICRKYPLTPNRIEEATSFFEREDAGMNIKRDTLYFEKEVREDELDLVDNDLNSGWPYND
jgi:hypothetical protein